jgi:hypothetical protein
LGGQDGGRWLPSIFGRDAVPGGRRETTGSRPEVLRDTSRRGTPAQDLEWWEKRETRAVMETLGRRELGVEEVVGEAGGVEMQQHEEPVGQKEELRPPALGDQQNLAEVDDTDDPMDKEATEALPATQLDIDHHYFRLRGICTQQLAGYQTKQPSTESYGANIQTGLILESAKTMYKYRFYGCLANDSFKTWSHR